LEIEPNLRKVNGHQHLKELREVMKRRLANGKAVKAVDCTPETGAFLSRN
jgi:hypothetical protein